MKGLTIKEIEIGQKACFEKTITETDVYLFAGITGDLNPAHLNAKSCSETMFKKQIAHGALSSGLVSAVLGMQLPGPGTIYISQLSKFTSPVYFGDTIKAEVEVIEKIEEKNRIKLRTTCVNQEGKMVLDGEALVMPPK